MCERADLIPTHCIKGWQDAILATFERFLNAGLWKVKWRGFDLKFRNLLINKQYCASLDWKKIAASLIIDGRIKSNDYISSMRDHTELASDKYWEPHGSESSLEITHEYDISWVFTKLPRDI